MLAAVVAWFASNGDISSLDVGGFDRFLRWRSPSAPAVSPRIVHLNIGEEEIHGWASTRQEYAGLSKILAQLRRQGAQVIALDLMLVRGEEADFYPFWDEVERSSSLVLGKSFDLGSRLPPGARVSEGLLYVDSDSDGLLRKYRLTRIDPKSGKPSPSLAMAAYLRWREMDWEPGWLGSDQKLRWTDVSAEGKEWPRCLPDHIWLDQRAGWQEETERNFFQLTPTQLQEWEDKGGPPRLPGKIVFVGYVSSGSGDLGATPLNPRLPKVAIHSLALNGLIQDAWYVPMPPLPAGVLGCLLVLVSAGVSRLSLVRALGLWFLGVLGLLGLGFWLITKAHLIPWLLSWLLIWTSALILELWQRDQLRHARLAALQVLADSEDPLLLKIVGNYQVVRKLGSGGFATVYQAVPIQTLDPQQSRALKIVHPASAESPEFRKRFIREVRIVSQLQHPNIVRVYNLGEDKGLLYMEMELLPGRPLKHYISPDAPWSVEETLQVLRPLLAALTYAHQQGIVHRDLKPDNIMVSMHQETQPWRIKTLKLVDFGLAFQDQASQLTRSGDVFGTLDYLAPERIQGRTDDPRSDLYAVGVMAYELLCGTNPFPQQTPAEAILFRITQDPPSLAERGMDLPDWLVGWVTRLMSRNPDERYATAQEASQHLEGQRA